MIDFLDKIEKSSYEIDRFIDQHLPVGNGLNAKLFEAMRYSSIKSGKKIRAFLSFEAASNYTNE